MPTAMYEEGTELVIDSEAVALGTGWTEPAAGSDVGRIGRMVFLALQLTNAARGAYSAETTYGAGALVTETGVTYASKAAGNIGHTPSSDAGVHWTVVAAPTAVCTLPKDYWPAATTVTPDGKFSISTAGVITSTYSLVAGTALTPLQLQYKAALVTP